VSGMDLLTNSTMIWCGTMLDIKVVFICSVFYDSYVFVGSRSLSLLYAWISDQGHDLGEGGEEQVAGHAFDLNVGELEEEHVSGFLAHA
jgi:hypothetical protein